MTLNHRTIVKIYIAYEISKIYNICSYPVLENCLFGTFSLTKDTDLGQYKYFGRDIGFDREEEISFGSNGIIVRANNKTKNILVLGKDFAQRLDNTTSFDVKMYSINFTKNNEKFCLSLHLLIYRN